MHHKKRSFSVFVATLLPFTACCYWPKPSGLSLRQQQQQQHRIWFRGGRQHNFHQQHEKVSKASLETDHLCTSTDDDGTLLPMDIPRRSTILIALAAIRRAAAVIQPLQPSLNGGDAETDIATVTKDDYSPVTVADFAAQAVVLRSLREAFPEDSFLAEESSSALRNDSTLLKAVQIALGASSNDTGVFQERDNILESIDLGQSSTPPFGRTGRLWCLDPIDGTKGFLRGEQYCIALALIEYGVPTIGILACPNLPYEAGGRIGCIFVASKEGGCYKLPLCPTRDDGMATRLLSLHHSKKSFGRFCLGVEESFGDAQGYAFPMLRIMWQTHPAFETAEDKDALLEEAAIVRMDSQAKYGVVASQEAEHYVRLPPKCYQEWLWDVAAGYVVLTEAGGVVTDTAGRDLDFSQGAKLVVSSPGILGSAQKSRHAKLVQAYQQAAFSHKEEIEAKNFR